MRLSLIHILGKRMLGCLVLAICMLGLGGCMFGNVDEMYALPKRCV